MNARNLIFIAFAAMLLINRVEKADAAMFYVDANSGNDSFTGTQDLPFRTAQRAADTAKAGDSVLVNPGDYNERVSVKSSGNASGYITFASAALHGASVLHGFRIDASFVRIVGFDITHDKGGWLNGGIWIAGNNIEIIGNLIHDVPGQAVSPSWGGNGSWDNVSVINNTIYKCNKGVVASGINWLVENNDISRLWEMDSEVPGAYGEDADFTRFFGKNITFRANYMHGTNSTEVTFFALNNASEPVPCMNFTADCASARYASHCGYDGFCRGNSHTDGFQTWDTNTSKETSNIIIENNVIEGHCSQVVMVSSVYGKISNITFRNNIIKECGSWGIDNEGVKGLNAYNNVFANIGIHGFGCRANGTSEALNNIFFNAGSNYWGCVNGSKNIIFSSTKNISNASYPNDLVNVDPIFTDPLNGDFHLQAMSPAIDGGAELSGIVDYDFAGDSRPQGLGWDIGAYEYTQHVQQEYGRADLDRDGCVDMNELGQFIDRWKMSNVDVSLREIIGAIGLWKKGC